MYTHSAFKSKVAQPQRPIESVLSVAQTKLRLPHLLLSYGTLAQHHSTLCRLIEYCLSVDTTLWTPVHFCLSKYQHR